MDVARSRGLGVVVATAVSTIALCFLLVYGTAFGDPTPRDLPVLVVGDTPLADSLAVGGTFDVEVVGSLAEARERLVDGDAYGAVGADADGLTLLLASGKGRSGASVVSTAITQVALASGQPLTVDDVVPLSPDNPTGSFEFYPVVFLGLAGGAGASVLARVLGAPRGRRAFVRRIGALALYTAAVAALFTVVVDGVLGALPGHTLGLFAVLWGYTLASAVAMSGVVAMFGAPAGIGLSLVLTMFGNASAGGPVVREAMPALYAGLHTVLPHGAAVDLIRAVQYFDGHDIAAPLAVLATWGVLGLAALRVAAWHPRWEPPVGEFELEVDEGVLVGTAIPGI